MAATNGPSADCSQVICKRCGKNVVKYYLKCEKCESTFHQSCAKISKNVKIISGNLINCCGVDNGDTATEAFFDAVESVSSDNKVDIAIFTYVVKQKDSIICELQDKIKIMHEYILMLKAKTTQDCESEQLNGKESVPKETTVDKIGDKNLDKKQEDCSFLLPHNVPQNQHTDTVLHTNKQKVKAVDPNIKVNTKQISAELLKIKTQLKCDEIINLNSDIKEKSVSHMDETTKNESQWNEVTHKRPIHRKNRIIGNNKDSSIKGVRKLVHLHVCRINIETTAMDLQDLLKPLFPEVYCETIRAKFPNLYSSFKVSIFEENFRKAMNPRIWPDGACISKFFQKKTTTSSVK